MTESDKYELCLEDFKTCGWEAVLDSVETKRAGDGAAAMRAASGGCETRAENALRTLAEVLEMGLQPEKPGGPYFPMIQMAGKRSFLPRDLSDDEVRALADFSGQITFPPLAARAADIAWIHPKTKHSSHAERAIQEFSKGSLDGKSWSRETEVSWLRAVHIGKELGNGGRRLLDGLYQRLLAATKMVDASRPRYVFDLARLLGTDHNRSQYANEVASVLDGVAKQLFGVQEFHWAADLHLQAAQWWRTAASDSKAARSLSDAADAKIAEAGERSKSGEGPNLTTVPLFEEAIDILRSVPKKDREGLRFDERIDDCRTRLRESQVMSFEHMTPFTAEIPGASEMAEGARTAVRGKPPLEALREFVSLHRVTPKAELLRQAEDSGREFLFRKICSSRVLARDGRTVAKVPALPFGDEESQDRSRALHADVVQNLSICQQVAVQAGILPAQHVLQMEHRLTAADFLELCRRSPVVAPDRRRTMADGLYAGFVGDYGTALYLLVPQLEHLTRVHIQRHGGHTSTITDGIEQEKGLSALMEMPEAKKVFGDDLGMELYVLFCDPLGPNLRNQVAHGLLSDGWALSIDSVYAWWFMLRLVMFPLMETAESESGKQSSPQGEADT